MTVTQTALPKLSQVDCRAKALDTIADLYDQILDVENHPASRLIIDHSIMRFGRLLLLGLSDLLINIRTKEN